jgi:UbiD family decarboxylase
VSFPDLRAFLDRLRGDGDLVTVDAAVDPRLEVAEIHRRVIAAGGPALLFTNVAGSRFRLATNLFGTARRAELAFGERPRRLIRRLVELADSVLPPTPSALWDARDVAWDLVKVGARRVAQAPVAEVITSSLPLTDLPAITSWPEDAGPFITLPLVYTTHPDRGGHNLGMYRMQVYDARRTGMHWQIGKGGGFHYAVAEARGRALPVNVALGGPPAMMLSAVAPLPENVPELLLASLLTGGRFPLADNAAGPLPLPATAEFVLVGEVPPGERRSEGPFGDHYGYYSLAHDYPVFRCRAMFHREKAVFPATVVGKPRQEDFFLGDFLQEILSPVFPVVMPAVVDLWSYGETGYHSLAAAVVKQRYKREAMASAFRILGEGQLSLTKFLLVLDRQRDLRDFRGVLEHVLERADFRTDLYVFGNLSMDTLDYTGPAVNEGSKGVLLGVGEPVRDLPREFGGALPAGVERAEVFCGGCLAVSGPGAAEEPDAAGRLAREPAFADWPLLVLVDDAAEAVRTVVRFLWTAFTRFEPAADIHAKELSIARQHIVHTPPVVIDARLKPGFPEELFCDPDTAKRVTRRWGEFFPGGMEMGDSGTADLG